MLVQTVNGIPGNWSSGNKIRELYISGKCPVQEIGIQIIDIGKRYIRENIVRTIVL